MRPDEIESRLRVSPLFRDVAPSSLHRFARETALVRVDEGAALWRPGALADRFMLVQRGLVQVLRRMPTGDVATLALFGPRECVGVVAVLNRKPWPAEAIAHGDHVEVLAVRAEPVLDAMREDPSLAMAANRVLCDATEMLRSRIDVLSAGAVPQRLAALLLHLGERFGDTDEGGALRIPLALSRASLARLVSARVETVIRTASEWQKRGLLVTDATGFEVRDAAALQQIVDEGDGGSHGRDTRPVSRNDP